MALKELLLESAVIAIFDGSKRELLRTRYDFENTDVKYGRRTLDQKLQLKKADSWYYPDKVDLAKYLPESVSLPRVIDGK